MKDMTDPGGNAGQQDRERLTKRVRRSYFVSLGYAAGSAVTATVFVLMVRSPEWWILAPVPLLLTISLAAWTRDAIRSQVDAESELLELDRPTRAET